MRKKILHLVSVAACLALVLAAGRPAHATVPGHNGLIAFAANTGAGYQIYTLRGKDHDLRQITNVSGDAVQPHWSPDGRQIVFEFDTATSANVAIMNADGSGLVDLPPLPNGFEDTPSFMPDGKRILFHRFEFSPCCDDAIWTMNLDGTGRQRIIGPPNGTTDPEAAPNGQTFSVVGFNGQPFGQALFTAGIDGSHLFQLTPFAFDVAVKQDWAPDGRHIVFSDNSDRPHPGGPSANIATVRPDGTDLRFLTHYQGGEVNAYVGSYSPDGRWIVFRLEDHGSFGLFKMHPDGSDVRTILGLSSFKPRFISWGPRPGEAENEGDDDNSAAQPSPAVEY
jgi:Tol biopolymer transport system component